MFASRSVGLHLRRGVGGLSALAGAVYFLPWGWYSLVLLPLGLVLLRGCPMCWVVGLVQTLAQGDTSSACTDGSCAVRTPDSGRVTPREGHW
jgi:hypothetical protein